jgi:hypothetical protein
LAAAAVILVTAVIIYYLSVDNSSGEELDMQPSAARSGAVDPGGGEDDTVVDQPFNSDMLPESGVEIKGAQSSAADVTSNSLPQTSSIQAIHLVVPDLGIDAIVPGVLLIPTSDKLQPGYQLPGQVGAAEGEPQVKVYNGLGDVIQEFTGLDAGAETFVYELDRLQLEQALQLENLPGDSQPMEIHLDDARWIYPTQDYQFAILTCRSCGTDTQQIFYVYLPGDGEGSSGD